jgi:hypothetical protein
MAAFGMVVIALSSAVGLTILRGIVLQALWQWFVVETFGIVALTLPQAIGLSIIASFLTYQSNARVDDESKTAGQKLLETAITGLLICGLYYIVGAFVHSFA